MSKLLDLKTKIESIPDKQRRKNLVGKLSQYGKLTAVASETLVKCNEAQHYAREVFTEDDFQKTSEHIKRAVTTATRLRSKLDNKVEAIETSDDKFTIIKEAAVNASSALKDRWNLLLTKKLQDLEPLVRVAKESSLRGSQKLEQILNKLRSQANNPPTSSDTAASVTQDLETLFDSVNNLGLQGAVGKFLIEAKDGKGRAQDLSDPEVKQFIDKHNLWNLLNVKLG